MAGDGGDDPGAAAAAFKASGATVACLCSSDTLYSAAVFDLDGGPVSIVLPDPGKRFMSMQVISQDPYTTEVVYAPGFERENVLVIDSLLERAEVNAAKETLKAQLLNLNMVTNATLSSHQPTQTRGFANFSSPYSVVGEEEAPQFDDFDDTGVDVDATTVQAGVTFRF